MAYPYAPSYGYAPVYPPSAHVTPIGQAGHVPLPPSPFAHHAALGYGGYAAPYFHSPSGIYGAAGAPLAPGYPHGAYAGASQLHGLLHYSRSPRLLFDLAGPLDAVRHADGLRLPAHEENASACLPEARIVRIVCAQLPWVIDVDTSTDESSTYAPRPISVGDLLQRVHTELRVRVTSPEYLIADKKKREAVGYAFKKRTESADKQEYNDGIKRVDWLGEARFFMGLTKDERVVKEILQARANEIPETWVMVVGTR